MSAVSRAIERHTELMTAEGQRSHFSFAVEERAPTDASIQLVEEYRQKAMASILEAHRYNNDIKVLIARVWSDHLHLTQVLKAVFQVNGTTYEIEVPFDHMHIRYYDKPMQEIALKLKDEIAGAISAQILGSLSHCDAKALYQ